MMFGFPKELILLSNPLISDNPTNVYISLIVGLSLIVIGMIIATVYNLSKKIKEKKIISFRH